MVSHDQDDRSACRGHRHAPGTAPRPAPSLRVCPACRDLAEETLRGLPTLFEMCAHALDTRPTGPRVRVRERQPRGIVLRDTVATARSEILGVLTSWCGLVATERGVPGPGEPGIHQFARFLGVHLHWLLQHPAAPDLVDELAELAATACAALGPDRGFRVAVGPCPRPGCDRIVHAEAGPDSGAPYEVACAAGHTWAPRQWLALRGGPSRSGRAAAPPEAAGMTPLGERRRTVPTRLAALAAGVTEATIRKWASRGKLTRYRRPGRAEYDLDELYELVVESRTEHGER